MSPQILRTQKLTGLIGHPVAHSLSPLLHNSALSADGFQPAYNAYDVMDLAGALERLSDHAGLNVTIPYKTDVLAHAQPNATSLQIGAANTLIFEGDSIRACNTDPAGLRHALQRLGAAPGACLLMGAGGAGRACAWTLVEEGFQPLTVCNRTKPAAVELCKDLGTAGYRAQAGDWEERTKLLGELVINATSIGLDGHSMPLAENAFVGRGKLLDLVYSPDETPLVRAARSKGWTASDGLDMLVGQAAASYALFWDCDPPLEVMAKAAQTVRL